MELEAITFNDIREIQKYEKEHEQLYGLTPEQLAKMKEYLLRKKQKNDKKGRREYENALDLVEEIIDRRAYKIMRLAFLSLKTNIEAEGLMEEEHDTFQILRDTLRHYRNAHLQYAIGETNALHLPSYATPATPPLTHNTEEGKATPAVTTDTETNTVETDTNEAQQEKEVLWEPNQTQEAGQDNNGTETATDATKEANAESYEELANQETETNENDYQSVTIQSNVPQFLGTDLQVYGPYDEGETITVPAKNAKLLIDRDLAKPSDT